MVSAEINFDRTGRSKGTAVVVYANRCDPFTCRHDPVPNHLPLPGSAPASYPRALLPLLTPCAPPPPHSAGPTLPAPCSSTTTVCSISRRSPSSSSATRRPAPVRSALDALSAHRITSRHIRVVQIPAQIFQVALLRARRTERNGTAL